MINCAIYIFLNGVFSAQPGFYQGIQILIKETTIYKNIDWYLWNCDIEATLWVLEMKLGKIYLYENRNDCH